MPELLMPLYRIRQAAEFGAQGGMSFYVGRNGALAEMPGTDERFPKKDTIPPDIKAEVVRKHCQRTCKIFGLCDPKVRTQTLLGLFRSRNIEVKGRYVARNSCILLKGIPRSSFQ
jgi:hypothetical protein